MLATFILLYFIFTRIYKFSKEDTLKALLVAAIIPLAIMLGYTIFAGGMDPLAFILLLLL